jgi:eukaryotic-like serine/threonine-protein kinase
VAEWDIPGYTELKALGSGAFGDVVLARHDASGTLVAIKYLRRDLLGDPESAVMFRSEAAVLASLDDPNVVRLYEYLESPSGAAIVMELVNGVSLRDILTYQGATTPEAALVVLEGSLLGLAAAHRRGVVHRDYKPENVLINGDGASKLTDFGIAARAGDRPLPAGTLAYAPPEQFAGAQASPASDVYAATATFYECLTGRPPFGGETVEALLYQHRSEPVPLDPVPAPLRSLVTAGMAKEPGDRPTDGTTLVAELNAVAAGVYGPGWRERGRSHLGEAALLLAALWPSRTPPEVQGLTVERIRLFRGKGAFRAAIAAAVAVAIVSAVTALTFPRLGTFVSTSRSVTAHQVPLQPSSSPPGLPGLRGSGSPGSGSPGSGSLGSGSPGSGSPGSGSPGSGSPGSGSPGSGSPGSGSPGSGSPGSGSPGSGSPGSGSPGSGSPGSGPPPPPPSSPPVVTGIKPSSGTSNGGTTVTIIGTGLANATSVTFGSSTAAITADTSTQITVTSPSGSGTVDITVTTPAGTSDITRADQFTYSDPIF